MSTAPRGIATVAGFVLALATAAGWAQDAAPVLDEPISESSIVTGVAEPGSAPITILDMSYKTPTPLGSGSSMDVNGYFAVSVSPILIEGNLIIARDAFGRESGPTVVIGDPTLPE
jgi:hypothetical protein